MKLSKHSKQRLKERTELNHKQRLVIFGKALRYGEVPRQIKDEKIRNYLLCREKFNSRIKLYQGYVFVYSKNSKQLYTMYKLPDELGSEE